MRSHAERVLTHQAAQARAENGADTPDPGQVAVPADPSFVAGLATGLKVKRRVTTPVLPFPEGSAIVCRIIDPIHESAIEGDNRFGGAPASVCTVEAQNGEVRILIAGTVLRKALERDYPNASYVALWFHIAKLARPDKAYADYAITEIEDPTPAAL
jgi:hypothetical protein